MLAVQERRSRADRPLADDVPAFDRRQVEDENGADLAKALAEGAVEPDIDCAIEALAG